MDRTEQTLLLAVFLLVVAVGGGLLFASGGVGDIVPTDCTTTAESLPDSVSDRPVNRSAISVNFTRSSDSTVFYYNSHDAIIMERPDGGYSLIVHNSNERRLLFGSDMTTVPSESGQWQPMTTRVNGDTSGGSIDTMVRVNGTYYAYQDSSVYLSRNISSEDWTHASDCPPANDHGIYYDDETGLFHLFYEAGNRSEHSGERIGHATSPNGVNNWTIHQPIYTPPAGYKVGDFDIVERNGVYLLFGDYTQDHPEYEVAVWANDNLYTNFTRIGTAMAPSDAGSGTLDGHGVQDPMVIANGSSRYVLFAHGHTGDTGPRYLHRYDGRIVVDDTAVVSNESHP